MGAKIITTNKENEAVVQDLYTPEGIPTEYETGFTESQFKALIDADVPIIGFVGGIEVDNSFLDTAVPTGFPNRTYLDAEDKEAVHTWKEYRNSKKISETKSMIIINTGKAPRFNRKDVMSYEELKLFINEFGVSINGSAGVLTKSAMIVKFPVSVEND